MTADAAELVLEHLLEHGGGTPAEDVAHKLGLAPAEVLAAVASLRAGGYDIGYLEREGERGFVILASPPAVPEEEIGRLLHTRDIGRHLVVREEVDSTSAVARQLAEEGAPHGTVVIARHQLAGRGRRGRSWVALPGQQLYATVVLRPDLPADHAFELTMLAAVALAEALEEFGLLPAIKWPNDIELDDRKLAGILSELAAADDGHPRFVLLGVGVNVDGRAEDFPEELRSRATSIRAATGRIVSVAALAASFFDRLEEWLVLHHAMGFAAVLDSWRGYTTTLGADVRALVDGQVIAGVAEDVDEAGALLVRDAAGKLHRIVAGEVTTLRRA